MSDDGTTQARTTTQLSGPAEEYLDGVRAALADLPGPEVAEILDEVRAHLADLTTELGGDPGTEELTARLGPPDAYADELRAAAGYPAAPGPEGRPRHGIARLAVAALVVSTLLLASGLLAGEPGAILLGLLLAALGLPVVARGGRGPASISALPEVRRLAAHRPAPGTPGAMVLDFLASLQPAWWVARAFAAAALVVGVLAGIGLGAVLLVGVLAVPVSVWVGRRSRRDRRWLWPVVPLNALAAVVLFGLLADGLTGSYPSPASQSHPAVYQSGLWQDGEREIRDIRPVDAAGNPLSDVYLFDQDGRPIDTSGGAECAHNGDGRLSTGVESNAPYPRGTWDYDPITGECRHVPPGPLVVAVPTTPTSTAGATAGPTATAAPGAGATTAPPPTTAAAPTTAAPEGGPTTAPPPVPPTR